jgi:hypothetical protein
MGRNCSESKKDSNYVFLCGVMWCRFGQLDADEDAAPVKTKAKARA